MQRLTNAQLDDLPIGIRAPAYARAGVTPGILHLGVGAFHRAHQAVYVDDILAAGDTRWGIVGASLRSQSVPDQLNPQQGLYSLMVRSAGADDVRIIGAIDRVLHAPTEREALLDWIADPRIRVVTLTITEKGYCHDPATGNLLADHPGVIADLADASESVTALGYLCAGLQRRKARGAGPVTLLSCDNLPSNGKTLAKVLTQFARDYDPQLAEWLNDNVSFPSSMIDRIVPATRAEDYQQYAEMAGFDDQGLVVTEPFTQWVVEDNFIAGRPAFESVGVQMVADVEAYEDIKLRCLNGAHSLLAYSGYLAGCKTIAETMTQPAFQQLLTAFWRDEVTPQVEVPEGFDLQAYQQQLAQRFKNPALKHTTWQIAMDGSQKIPQRWLATLRGQLSGTGSVRWLSFGLACWMRYVAGVDESGETIDVQDPLAKTLAQIASTHSEDTRAWVSAILSVTSVFGEDLHTNHRLQVSVADWLVAMRSQGTLAALSASLKL